MIGNLDEARQKELRPSRRSPHHEIADYHAALDGRRRRRYPFAASGRCSGSFGILLGTRISTSLVVSIVSWQSGNETRHHCAVRGGVLSVNAGRDIAIATREAVTATTRHP